MGNGKVIEELEQVRAASGGLLKPEAVVKFAESPDTALHACFQWDDSKAAHAYRLVQARGIIRVAVRVLETPSGQPVEARAFVSISEDRANGGGYRAMADVLSDEDMHRRMMADALKELEAFRRRYQSLEELSGLFAAIDAISAMDRAA